MSTANGAQTVLFKIKTKFAVPLVFNSEHNPEIINSKTGSPNETKANEIMYAAQETEHESSIDAEVLCTSYKWNLRRWSLLYDHYNKGVTSPEFNISASTPCKCKLSFNAKGVVSGRNCTSLQIEFIGKINCRTMQITVSFVNQDMKKLSTCKSVYQNATEKAISLSIHEALTETTSAKYLQNDTLILYFEMHIVTDIIDSPITTNTCIPNHITNAREGITDLYNRKDLCDVAFYFKDTEKPLSAHKVVLAANSPVFRAMFTNKMKEQTKGTVDVDDIHYDLFERFLSYMYTGKVADIENVAEELIAVAHKYAVPSLIDLCEKYMAAHLNDSNAINYLIIGHRYSSTILEKMATEYIQRNTHVLAYTDDDNLAAVFPNLVKQIFSK